MSKEATAKVKKELKKLKMMRPTSAEATVVRNYIDWILSLPWYEKTEERTTSRRPRSILDEDHYGLRKIKERILEYLAVQALTKKLKGPVLCFVGPPGRRQDEPRQEHRARHGPQVRAAVARRRARRGRDPRPPAHVHRRDAGKLIQSLKKAGTNNPLFLLDEVDKMSTDFRGDPAAALLEVLDPEQNSTFNDHYLDLDYDLSDVMFITTANTLGGHPRAAPGPHGDHPAVRLHEFEKLNIAVKYLVPRQTKDCGLEDVPFTITESAIRTVIHHYTKEAGVRSLEREIAEHLPQDRPPGGRARGKDESRSRSSPKRVPKYLGVPKYSIGKTEEQRRDWPDQRPVGDVQRGRRAARLRGRGRGGQGQAGHHRPAREGDGGERAGGDELRARRGRSCSGSSTISTRRSTSTCTSRSSSARTGRARA